MFTHAWPDGKCGVVWRGVTAAENARKDAVIACLMGGLGQTTRKIASKRKSQGNTGGSHLDVLGAHTFDVLGAHTLDVLRTQQFLP